MLGGFSCFEQHIPQEELAKVNDVVLTKEMLFSRIDTTHGISEADIQRYTQQWITSQLLFQEAQRLEIVHSEEVQQRIADATQQISIAALLEKEVFTFLQKISSEEIQKYYQQHKQEFLLSEDLAWISFVVFQENSAATTFRSSVLSKKNWNEERIRFQNSELITHSDSLFSTQSTLFPPELWKVASALGKDEVSFPVKTSAGYFVIQSLGLFKKSTIAPIASVENQIRERIQIEHRQQRYAEYVEDLRKKANVEVNTIQ